MATLYPQKHDVLKKPKPGRLKIDHFELFFDSYHKITKMHKVDKCATKKYFDTMAPEKQLKAKKFILMESNKRLTCKEYLIKINKY